MAGLHEKYRLYIHKYIRSCEADMNTQMTMRAVIDGSKFS